MVSPAGSQGARLWSPDLASLCAQESRQAQGGLRVGGGRARCPASSDRWLHFKNPSTFMECGLTSKESAHSQRRPQTNPSLTPISPPPPPPSPEGLPALSPLLGLDLGWKPRALRRPLWASRAKGKVGAPRPVQGAGSALSAVNVTTVIKPIKASFRLLAKLHSVLVENVPPPTKLLFHTH